MSRTRIGGPKPKPDKAVIDGMVAIVPYCPDAMMDKFTYEGMPIASITYRIMWPASKRSCPKRNKQN